MRILIKTLLTIIVLVVVVVAGGLIYLVNMDPNNHKQRIANMVHEQTGLVLHLDGDIGLTFYPWLGVSIEDVTLENPPGYGEEHLLRLESAQFRVLLMPALRGRYEIDTVRVHGADINLIVNDQGRGNWESLAGEPDPTTEPQPDGDGLPLGDVVLGGVDIRNGRVTFDDRQSGQRFEIRDFMASTGELVYGEPIALELSLDALSSQPELRAQTRLEGIIAYDDDGQRYDITPLTLDMTLSGPNVPDGSADLRLTTAIHVDLEADTLNIPELDLQGPGLSLIASIEGRHIQSNRSQFETDLSLSGEDMGLLFRIAEMEDMAQRIASLDSPGFDLSTHITISPADGDVDLSRLDAQLLGASIDGRLTASGLAHDEPLVNGALNAEGPDLPALVQLIGQILEGRDSPLAAMGREMERLPDSSFRVNTAFEADLAAGFVTVPALEAQLVGNRIEGSLEASGIDNGTPRVEGTLDAEGPDLPILVQLAGLVIEGPESQIADLGRELEQLPDNSFRINTAFQADMEAGTANVPAMEGNLMGTSFDATVEATAIDTDAPQFRGQLNANGPDLPLLLQVAGRFQGADSPLALYGQQLGSLEQRNFLLESEFDVDLAQGNINLPLLHAEALGLRIDAQLTASDIENNGSVDGRLQVQGDQLAAVLRAMDQADLADVLQGINLESEVSGSLNDLVIAPLSLSLRLDGAAVSGGPQTVTINAESRVNLDQERLDIERLQVSGAGLDVAGQVLVNRFIEAPEFEGQLQVAAFDLRELLQRLGQEAPDTADPSALAQVGLQTRFRGSLDGIAAEELQLLLDDTTLEGNFSVENFEAPRIRFALNIDEINADRYLPEPLDDAPPADTEEEVELPVDLLRGLNVEGNLDIARLTIMGLRLQNLSARANGANGELALSPLSMDLYRGRYEGNLALNVANELPQLSFDSTLNNVALEPLLVDFMDATFLTGTSDIRLELESSGPTVDSLIRNLNGSGNMAVSDGVLRGVNIGATLAQIEAMIRSQRLGSLNRGEETRFDQFSASLNITDGAIRSNDLEIRAPGFRVTGNGLLADLGEERINFNLVASVDRSTATVREQEYNIGGHSLPIACTGRLDAPRCLPDFEAVVRQELGGLIERRLGDFLERQLGR